MTPESTPPPKPTPPPQRVVVPSTTRREVIFSVLCGIGVLVFVIIGIMTMGNRQQAATSNTLTGKIEKKEFTAAPEDQVSFGSKGTGKGHIAGFYTLHVRVKGESRVFEVPVDANTYEAVRAGDSFSFMRPRSEQKR